MTSRNKIYLLIAIAVFLGAIGLDWHYRTNDHLQSYATKIEAHLHQQEEEVEVFFSNKTLIKELLQSHINSSPGSFARLYKPLNQLTSRDYTISIYQHDSLIFWSNTSALPPMEEVVAKSPQRQQKLVNMRNGQYELIKQSFIDKATGSYTLIGLIPIKYGYSLESNHLRTHFPADPGIASNIRVSNKASGQAIRSKSGTPIAFLLAEGTIADQRGQQLVFWFYLAAFICLGIFINFFAKQLSTPQKPWLGPAFLTTAVFGIRLISILFDFSGRFDQLPLFSDRFSTTLSGSLGDLVINIVLLLWVMIFFHKEARLRSFDHLGKGTQFLLTSLNYFAILTGILIITSVFKNLVFNSSIVFDFDNVFNLNRYSFIAIVSVILLLIALFLFSHRMMLAIIRIGLDRYRRLAALSLASLAAAPLLAAAQLLLPTIYLLLIAFVFILIFDLFVDSNMLNFTWLVIWLIILSAFPSILLFKYNAYKDRIVRLSYARQLGNFQDTLLENSVKKLTNQIDQKQLLSFFSATDTLAPLDGDKLLGQIKQVFTSDNYLLYNYDFDLYAFDQQNVAMLANQSKEIDFFTSSSSKKLEATQVPRLSRWLAKGGSSSYILELLVQKNDPIKLYLDIYRKRREKSKVYSELLVDKQYKNLQDLHKYDYAIYKDGYLLDAEGNEYGSILEISQLPKAGSSVELLQGERSEIVYHGADGIVVIISKEKELFIRAISLFSYIFGMLIALVLVLAILNSLTGILPNTLRFTLTHHPSLKSRIQLSVISLIVASFIIIGMVTVWFFRTSSEDYHEGRLERKTQSVLADVNHELELQLSLGDSAINLSAIIKPISTIHRMDVNLYDLSGALINSSEEDIFNKGIISRRMSMLAYLALDKYGHSEYIQDGERVGELTYKAAYIPLRIKGEKGERTLAYMGLPYYSKQSQLRSDVTVFMSTLLNVYVFLLLIAAGIAIVVANSITQPLARIGENLKQVKLGKLNQPLEWKSKDELGALIEQYNDMISQLAQSADRLAQSEREGAWREMAKQVAHEIKNPLTPMKLSIQYLQHAYRSNPEDIEPLLKRVSGTLIEQIDNLAQIASEFSNFAKMPRAENQKVWLNDLIRSVFDLFSNESLDLDLDLFLSLPEEQYFVYADKNHLMRVLNNLIKNAIQAIPDDRKGSVEVSLHQNENLAIIKVEDNGSGIAKDKQDKVFVPNFTTKSSGTGLGLAISKNIIESVNGEIYFETLEGQGTTFFVKLPLIEVTELENVD